MTIGPLIAFGTDFAGLDAGTLRVDDTAFSIKRDNLITDIHAEILYSIAREIPGSENKWQRDFSVFTPGSNPGVVPRSTMKWENFAGWIGSQDLINMLKTEQILPAPPPVTFRSDKFQYKNDLLFWLTCWEDGRIAYLAGAFIHEIVSRVSSRAPIFTPLNGTVIWNGHEWESTVQLRWMVSSTASNGPTWSSMTGDITWDGQRPIAPGVTWEAMKLAPLGDQTVYGRR